MSLSPGFLPYDLNTPLFSDYAHKLRAVWLPTGTHARYSADGVFDFPVGTIISKTFYYPRATAPDGALLRNDDNRGDFSGEGLDLTQGSLDRNASARATGKWLGCARVRVGCGAAEATLEVAGDIKRLIWYRPTACIRSTT